MSGARRVPEAAPVVGLLLALSFAIFALLFTDAVLSAVLVSVTVLYAFTAYGIYHDDDPANTLRPDPILAGGVLGAGLVLGYTVVTGGRPLFGLFVALVVVAPAALYHARYGEAVNPLSPLSTLAVAGAVAAAVLAYGVAVDDSLLATVDAVLLVLAAEDYRGQRGDPLTRAAERVAVVACLGGALLALAYFLFAGTPTTALLVAGALVVVGAYFAMNGQGFDGGRG